MLAVTPTTFDVSLPDLLLPLVCGGSIVVASENDVRSGEGVRRLIDHWHPDLLQATPSLWRLLVLTGWRGDPNRLRAVSAGEALPSTLVEELIPRCRELWNLYGPTEATIYATAKRVVSTQEPGWIGRPIDNARVYVLDDARRPVPPGVAGELWIGGAGLARGYLGSIERTRERFVPDLFAGRGRMYRTGDRARWTRHGELVLLGRLDDQVKLRGHRIELGEIEAVLGKCSGVLQVACVLSLSGSGDPRIVAYYVAHREATEPELDLAHVARAKLPAAMVPTAFIRLDALPLNQNAKVDRRALARRPLPAPVAPRDREPLGSREEEEIAAVWRRVLDVERIEPTLSFFEQGGHSLLLAHAHLELRERYPRLTMLDYFRYPSLPLEVG